MKVPINEDEGTNKPKNIELPNLMVRSYSLGDSLGWAKQIYKQI